MKLPEFRTADLHEKTLVCPHCHWTGKGADAAIIDFYGIGNKQEIHCPQCDTLLGILKTDDTPPH